MSNLIRITFTLFFLSVSTPDGLAVSGILQNAQHQVVDIPVNDVIYDSHRDILYASVPSTANSPYENSIAMINPSTGSVLDSIAVGNDPNQLAISSDGSRVYVGLDGDSAIRFWQPRDGLLGPLRSISDPAYEGLMVVAEDLAVPPGHPDVVVVSKDLVVSSDSGVLEVFNDSTSVNIRTIDFANRVSFIDSTTMIAVNLADTAHSATRWEFDGLNLTFQEGRFDLVNDDFVEGEADSNGNIYYSDGTIVDAESMTIADKYNTGLLASHSLVQHVNLQDWTYFVGRSATDSEAILKVFDGASLEELDAISLPVTFNDRYGELIVAGPNRLAFVAEQLSDNDARTLSIISNIPVIVPEPSGAMLLVAALTVILARQKIVRAENITSSDEG